MTKCFESPESHLPLNDGGVSPELPADRQKIHIPFPEDPAKTIKRHITQQIPLFFIQSVTCSFPHIGPISGVLKKCYAIIPELNLKSMLLITAVSTESAKIRSIILRSGFCETQSGRKSANCSLKCNGIAFQNRPVEYVFCHIKQVMSNKTR